MKNILSRSIGLLAGFAFTSFAFAGSTTVIVINNTSGTLQITKGHGYFTSCVNNIQSIPQSISPGQSGTFSLYIKEGGLTNTCGSHSPYQDFNMSWSGSDTNMYSWINKIDIHVSRDFCVMNGVPSANKNDISPVKPQDADGATCTFTFQCIGSNCLPPANAP